MTRQSRSHGSREQRRAAKHRKRAKERRKKAAREHTPLSEPAALERLAAAKVSDWSVLAAEVGAVPRDIVAKALGSPTPKTYGDLATAPVLPFTDSLDNELVWACAAASRFSTHVSAFLKAQEQLDRLLVTGAYGEAALLLPEMFEQAGASLALLRSALLVADLSDGLRGNRITLQRLAGASTPAVFRIFAGFLSQRAEKNLSSVNYDKEVDSFCRRHVSTPGTRKALAHFRFSVNFQNSSDFSELPYILYRDSIHPVIDLGSTCIRVLQILYCSSRPLPPAYSAAVGALARIQDRRVATLAQVLDPRAVMPVSPVATRLMTVVDAFTVGDYARSLSEATAGLTDFPTHFEFYELQAKSSLYAKRHDRGPFAEGTMAARILDCTFDVLGRTSRFSDALRQLRKLALALDGAPLADQLLAFVLSNESPSHPLSPRAFAAINSSVITPRFCQVFDEPEKRGAVLDTLEKAYGDGPAIQLFREAQKESPDLEGLTLVPPLRRKKYRAGALLRGGRFGEAAPLYREIAAHCDDVTPLEGAALAGLFTCLVETMSLDEAVRLAVDVHFRRPELLSSIALQGLLTNRDRVDAPRTTGIDWPILAHLHHGARSTFRDLEALYAAYDTLLVENGVTLPSELAHRWSPPNDPRLIYFLRHVCSADVMDNDVLAFANTADLHAERLTILRHLLLHDPGNADIYQQDISRLIQADRVAAAIQRVGESKVFVDVAGIARSLGTEFRERFDRYVAFSRLTDQLRETYALDDKALADAQVDGATLVISDASREQFAELFLDLKELFVSSSEYGLDFYLSVRIRHGTLTSQLRSQFEKEQLITRRNKSDGVYDRNEHWWRASVDLHGHILAGAVDNELRRFSRSVDDIIEEVKSSWIQIKSQQRPVGHFDFDYTEDDLLAAHVNLLALADYEEFVQGIFAELVRRTEVCLTSVRTRIQGELRTRLMSALDSLSEGLAGIHPALRHSQLEAAVARCRTTIEFELQAVAAWFGAVTEQEMPDFPLRTVVDTAAEIVKYCNPQPGFSLSSVECPALECRGYTFAALIDVFHLLFDNVVRHSHTLPAASATIELKNGQLTVSVLSSIGESVDRAALALQVARLNALTPGTDARSIVRREGGSGYYKVHKLISHALDRGSDYSVSVNLLPNAFEVRLRLPSEGLLSEGTDR